MTRLRRKYGVVALLDALGASNYSDAQIKKFLSTRAQVNSWVAGFAKQMQDRDKGKLCDPTIFTFGDTIVMTIELRSKKFMVSNIFSVVLLLRRYLFHSLLGGVLFRGAFSIGHYFDDAESNTVMGPAVADAAVWYTRSDWMGIASTPKTNSVIEYHLCERPDLIHPEYIYKYPVPLKDGTSRGLYTISWPAAFFNKSLLKEEKKDNPRRWFLEILKELPVPAGTENKYHNTKTYFDSIEKSIEKDRITDTNNLDTNA